MNLATMGGFWLVADLLDVQADLPHDLNSQLRLCRATDKQIQCLDVFFDRENQFRSPRNYYEYDWTPRNDGSIVQENKMPRSDWRYFLLAFKNNAFASIEFQLAANLGEPPLTFFHFIYTDGEYGEGARTAWSGDDVQAADWYQPPIPPPLVVLNLEGLNHLNVTYERLRALDRERYAGIWRAVNSFQELKRIPRQSDLMILGYFSIIEMLLTHNPNDKEVGDSLMHQIRTKVALLNKRLAVPFDYSSFQIASEEKIWNKLYGLRSLVAHGGHVDFASSELRSLKDRNSAIEFLKGATRRLLRHALEEPQLVDSLKPI
jgi:hypothetical protein